MSIPESSLGSLLSSKLNKPSETLTSEKRFVIIEGLKSLSKKPDEEIKDLLPGLDEELKDAIAAADAADRAQRIRDLADVIRAANNRLNTSTMQVVEQLRQQRRQLAAMQQRLQQLNELKRSAAQGNLVNLIQFAYPELTPDLFDAELLGSPQPVAAKKVAKKAR